VLSLVRDHHLQELATDRGDLIGDFRPGVGRAHDRSPTRCGTDGRQSGHSRSGGEHHRRRNLSGSRHLAGEEPAELVRRFDDRPVPGDVRHRAQHVHRLGP
jgi:hypothetical protein